MTKNPSGFRANHPEEFTDLTLSADQGARSTRISEVSRLSCWPTFVMDRDSCTACVPPSVARGRLCLYIANNEITQKVY